MVPEVVFWQEFVEPVGCMNQKKSGLRFRSDIVRFERSTRSMLGYFVEFHQREIEVILAHVFEEGYISLLPW